MTLRITPIVAKRSATEDLRRLTTEAYRQSRFILRNSVMPALRTAQAWALGTFIPSCTKIFLVTIKAITSTVKYKESHFGTPVTEERVIGAGHSNTPPDALTRVADWQPLVPTAATTAGDPFATNSLQGATENRSIATYQSSESTSGPCQPTDPQVTPIISADPPVNSLPTKLVFPEIQRPQPPKRPSKPDSSAPLAVVCRFGQGNYLKLCQATADAPNGAILRVKRGSYSLLNVRIRDLYLKADERETPVVLESGYLDGSTYVLNDPQRDMSGQIVFDGFRCEEISVFGNVHFVNCKLKRVFIRRDSRRLRKPRFHQANITFTDCIISESVSIEGDYSYEKISCYFSNCQIIGHVLILKNPLRSDSDATVIIEGSTFFRGGVFFASRSGTLLLRTCSFERCRNAVEISAGTAIIEDTTINASQIAVSITGESRALVEKCGIFGEWVGANTAAIMVDQYSLVRIIDCQIEGGYAAILARQGMVDVQRCTIRNARTGIIFLRDTTGRVADCDLRRNGRATWIAREAQIIYENTITDSPASPRSFLNLVWSKLQTKLW